MNTVVVLLHALKGCSLAVLIAIADLGRAGSGDLEFYTGYDHKAIAKSLARLSAMQLIISTSRYHGWQLTEETRQLSLFREGAKSALEGAKSALPTGSSSGSLTDLTPDMVVNLTTTTTTGEGAKSALEGAKSALPWGSLPQGPLLQGPLPGEPPPPAACAPSGAVAALAELLVERVACPRKRALAAVEASMSADAIGPGAGSGWSPAQIELQLLRWLAWLNPPAGGHSGNGSGAGAHKPKRLDNPGYFIAAKLANREPAPAGAQAEPYSADHYRIQKLTAALEAGTDPDAGGEDILAPDEDAAALAYVQESGAQP